MPSCRPSINRQLFQGPHSRSSAPAKDAQERTDRTHDERGGNGLPQSAPRTGRYPRDRASGSLSIAGIWPGSRSATWRSSVRSWNCSPGKCRSTWSSCALPPAQKDWKLAAHTIKGSALAVGARRLASLAQMAERLDVDADPADSQTMRRMQPTRLQPRQTKPAAISRAYLPRPDRRRIVWPTNYRA